MNQPSHIIFAGGGTGGHLFPALAIMEDLERLAAASQRRMPQCEFWCSPRPLDAEILRSESVVYRVLPAAPLGLHPRRLLRFLASWPGAVRTARERLAELRAQGASPHVVAMGGFVAAPAARAAQHELVPLTLVNLDAVPGRANRWMSRLTSTTFTAARGPGTLGWREIPPLVRDEARAPGDADDCRRQLGLDPTRPTLMVTGASQGAMSINQFAVVLAKMNAAEWQKDGWQVVHQTGKDGVEETRAGYERAGIPAVVEPFFQHMGLLWGAADLAVSRCGAGSVAEAWANATPAILMPYPYHKDQHQKFNAEPLVRAGGARLCDDHVNPTANVADAGAAVLTLMRDVDARDRMRAALRGLGPADGAQRIAEFLLDAP